MNVETPTIPSRESAQTRARRHLIEGHLCLTRVTAHEVEGTCRGSGTIHHLGYSRGGWWCTCEARGRCSHLIAAGLVVAVDL